MFHLVTLFATAALLSMQFELGAAQIEATKLDLDNSLHPNGRTVIHFYRCYFNMKSRNADGPMYFDTSTCCVNAREASGPLKRAPEQSRPSVRYLDAARSKSVPAGFRQTRP
ncbi:hypothetical protein EVAR_90667_1 [Eumeta japonica]|uniref:Uncharacterized protein n=1 Tax=Eumeta variegata TaxID=151549 RepID=A0A4C1ZE44_EUMVA|nr:hypothetical protein EVAR_90667_1 [Eumeta japonica]